MKGTTNTDEPVTVITKDHTPADDFKIPQPVESWPHDDSKDWKTMTVRKMKNRLKTRDINGMLARRNGYTPITFPTPLLCAARYCENPDVIQYMIDEGADIQARTEHGVTVLMLAASMNTIEVIEVLLKAGAKLKDQDNKGNTPLMWASKSLESDDVIDFLISKGAKVKSQNFYGDTAADIALYSKKMMERGDTFVPVRGMPW